MKNTYGKFFLMLGASFVSMYFIMFLNIFEWSHYYNSLTRLYMTILMICPMALIMLFFMKDMYTHALKNTSIVILSIFLFTITLFGLRAQSFVSDVDWMKAMIPHHSTAILTSNNANLQDPEVRQLAEEIIDAQVKEIDEMKALIEKLEGNDYTN